MRVGILHYAGPPGIGGVEQTIYYHARELTRAGYSVRVLAGAGAPLDVDAEVRIIPEFGSSHPQVLAVKEQLDRGELTTDLAQLCDRVGALLEEALAGLDVLIAHNVFTLHKNLPLTAALHREIRRRPLKVLGWHHDLAWQDPRYQPDLHAGYPWDLLRQPWTGVRHVTVSAAQRTALAQLYGIPSETIAVVPPGVDVARFFRWTADTTGLVTRLALLDADALLLLPARLTRRKNVELAMRILAAVRQHAGWDARLIVTGPPGPHNPANAAYLEGLLRLRRDLGLEGAAHLLYEQGLIPDDATMANLYGLADALLFTSAQEGFGIPLLEAGLARLPIFCSDIPPFREVGQDQVQRFPVDADPVEVARRIVCLLETDPAARLRRRVLAEYQWEQIVRCKVMPLLEEL
jgi:glycosyltransferase involved in cell wall biosynthesis